MKHQQYPSGLEFIGSTYTRVLGEDDRKAIKSHAAKVSKQRRKASQLESWLSPNNMSRPKTASHLMPALTVSIPRQVGSFFSGIELPEGIEPCMIQDIVSLIDLNKHGAYPHEICLQMKVVERGWFPYMLSDACCLHSMLFSARVLVERASKDPLSSIARGHYAETLRLLQLRLVSQDVETATSDATLMVITTLAAVASFAGDLSTTAMHVEGLAKIVRLRGGVRALTAHRNMQVKVCRSDLAYALTTGERPLLFSGDISWECYIADRSLVHCSHEPYASTIQEFVERCIDTRLYIVWKDLHAFCCLSNIAYQTKRKMSTGTYNEIVISLLYRLTNLAYEDDPTQEAFRLGLLVLTSSIFLQRATMQLPFQGVTDAYDKALSTIPPETWSAIPAEITFWLCMTSHVGAAKPWCSAADVPICIDRKKIFTIPKTWSDAASMLRSVAWIDFIHEQCGKEAWMKEASVSANISN